MDQKPKLYDTETITQAARVQAHVDEVRARVDAMRAARHPAEGMPMIGSKEQEQIAASLAGIYRQLGADPIAVANTLGAMGVRGVLFGERCCPLANLGRMATGVWVHVASGRYAIVDGHSEPLWYRLPQACAQMTIAFDGGDYPWLEREPQGDEGCVTLAGQEGHNHAI